MFNPVIDLFIIGVQKAGTSSFLHYLTQHPQICSHQQPEMNFFVDEVEFEKGYSAVLQRYFPCSTKGAKILAAKSVGIIDSPKFIRRIYEHNSKMQVVILLRNPVDRAYSAYWFARRKGWENLNQFEDALEAGPSRFAGEWPREQECSYLKRGIYVHQIQAVLDCFPRTQVYIFQLEEIRQDVLSVCQTLYKACDIAADFVPEVHQRYNTATLARSDRLAYLISNAKPIKKLLRHVLPPSVADNIKHTLQRWNQKKVGLPQMQPETRARLLDFYRPYNHELSQLLGQDLTHWDS